MNYLLLHSGLLAIYFCILDFRVIESETNDLKNTILSFKLRYLKKTYFPKNDHFAYVIKINARKIFHRFKKYLNINRY